MAATWNPRLVKTPVPTMFATTTQEAVKAEMRGALWVAFTGMDSRRATLSPWMRPECTVLDEALSI